MLTGLNSTKLICFAGGLPKQGKSTLIMLLAALSSTLNNFNVLVVELEENRHIQQLRLDESGSINFNTSNLLYEIATIKAQSFHSSLPSYSSRFNLILVEIPSTLPMSLYTDILLLSEFIICPVIAVQPNFITNAAFFQRLKAIKNIKSEKKLNFEIYALFNQSKPGQEFSQYHELQDEYKFQFFASSVRYHASLRSDISTILLPGNLDSEFRALNDEFISLIMAPSPYLHF